MSSDTISRLADLLVAAREGGSPITSIPAELLPADAVTADAVQDAVMAEVGPVAACKVFHGTGDGTWGPIPANRLLASGAGAAGPIPGLKVEAEIAFRLKSGLPGKADGSAYSRAEVEAAIGEALVAIEILADRLPAGPDALTARADSLGNWGLVTGDATTAWAPFAEATDYAVSLTIAGTAAVGGARKHPSGVDPLHPVVWLANHLASRGTPLKAGGVVTTGAFGGGHPAKAGDTVVASVEGLGSATVTFL